MFWFGFDCNAVSIFNELPGTKQVFLRNTFLGAGPKLSLSTQQRRGGRKRKAKMLKMNQSYHHKALSSNFTLVAAIQLE